jgi:phage terminase large subunit
MAGIDLVKSLRVHTRPENVNVNKEAGIYKWREDRDGNPMDEPVKFADHSMDAIRYALHTHLGGPERRVSSAQPDAFEGIGIFARKRRQS